MDALVIRLLVLVGFPELINNSGNHIKMINPTNNKTP